MKLFIGNIPSQALVIEIYDFLGGLQLQADFQTREGRTRESECYHYVVAKLSDKEDIQKLVKQYDGMLFQGSPLIVREFIDRHAGNDWQGEEKRINAQ